MGRRTAFVTLLLASLAATVIARPVQAAEKLKVLTTFTVIADIATNVAGDTAEVVSITKPGADIHTYSPTPGDIRRALGAGLVLRNGLNLELWFEKFLRNLGEVPAVTVSDGISPIGITEGPYEGKPNPHAWMSPEAAKIYVANIRDALSAADPAHAATYAANATAYTARIDAVAAPIRERLAALPPDRRWLVTSEGAFSYLARDFGLKEAWIWPINADGQGTPQQVRRVIDTVRAHEIPVVFSESTVSPDPARQVARETGARYGGVLYVDTLTDADGPVPTYLDLLRVTAGRIADELSRP
ncbi:metal ABC transporter substrate-binding protein [Tistrella mobilis]